MKVDQIASTGRYQRPQREAQDRTFIPVVQTVPTPFPTFLKPSGWSDGSNNSITDVDCRQMADDFYKFLSNETLFPFFERLSARFHNMT